MHKDLISKPSMVHNPLKFSFNKKIHVKLPISFYIINVDIPSFKTQTISRPFINAQDALILTITVTLKQEMTSSGAWHYGVGL